MQVGPHSFTVQAQQLNYTTQTLNQTQEVREPSFNYSIKLIPKKKSEFAIQKLRQVTGVFKSIKELKKDVSAACCGDISIENFGYIEPGHANRGKQQWLSSEEDLKDMYRVHNDKSEILLWSLRLDVGRKRAHSPDVDRTLKRTRYDKYLDKMTEVEMIEQELKDKHTEYSDEQIRSWAHLIQMKKHASYDQPPNKRFWKVPQQRPLTDGNSTSSTGLNACVSPGKRVSLRGQCVQQLLQLHDLLEKRAISNEQYKGMQFSIMNDVKKLVAISCKSHEICFFNNI